MSARIIIIAFALPLRLRARIIILGRRMGLPLKEQRNAFIVALAEIGCTTRQIQCAERIRYSSLSLAFDHHSEFLLANVTYKGSVWRGKRVASSTHTSSK